MKIEFDKALLWLIPYLYLVSVAYYWGYWGSFGIDAFNYYPVSDLVKGVTTPIFQTFLFVLVAGFLIMIINFLLDVIASKFITLAIIIALILGTSSIYFTFSSTPTKSSTGYSSGAEHTRIIYLVMANIVAIASTQLNSRLPKLSLFKNALRQMAIYFVLLLPCRANVDGQEQAWRIQNNMAYDYTLSDSLATPQKEVYKFLGKAGEYYILLTKDNVKQVIVPTSKLSPLIIEKLSLEDTASIRRFKIHQKELEALSPSKSLSKQL